MESAIVSALEMGIGPLFVLIFALIAKDYIPRMQWFIAFGTLIACMVLIFAVLSGKSAMQMAITFPVILAILAVGRYIMYRKLSEAGWTTSMILANRYYGIILLSFLATYEIFFDYFSGNIGWIITVTATGVMLPMYLLQIGIRYCSPLMVMMSL